MKYFFLSEGWAVGRVWTVGGLWSETAWRRPPDLQKINLCLWDQNERMWLHRVEDAVLMVEVYPTPDAQKSPSSQSISHVVLTRLINAEQVLEHLCTASAICQTSNSKS